MTVAFNVPLDDRLAAAGLSGPDLETRRRAYRRAWTAWNHVRAIASLAAAAAFVACAWLQ